MANEIIEIRRETRITSSNGEVDRVSFVFLYPVTDPVATVVPTPSEGLNERERLALTAAELAELDAGTMAFERVQIADRTRLPVDLERRTRAYRDGGRDREGLRTRLENDEAEAKLAAEEDQLVADPAAFWIAGVRKCYAAKLAAFGASYDAQYRAPAAEIVRIDAQAGR